MSKFEELIDEVRHLRNAIERAFPATETSDEITTREALKLMHCNTSASLTGITRLFPSVKVRRGIYNKTELTRALKARQLIKKGTK